MVLIKSSKLYLFVGLVACMSSFASSVLGAKEAGEEVDFYRIPEDAVRLLDDKGGVYYGYIEAGQGKDANEKTPAKKASSRRKKATGNASNEEKPSPKKPAPVSSVLSDKPHKEKVEIHEERVRASSPRRIDTDPSGSKDSAQSQAKGEAIQTPSLTPARAQIIHDRESVRLSNGIVARVGDEVITWNELNEEMAPLIPQIRNSTKSLEAFQKQLGELEEDILENMINRILIVNDFKSHGFEIPSHYIERALTQHVQEYFNGDRARFFAFLEEEGRTELDIKRKLEKNIIVDAMRQRIRSKVGAVSPDQIQRYYLDNKVSFFQKGRVYLGQIMIKRTTGEPDEVMRQSAQAIIRKFKEGRSFAELARQYSQDSTAESGGDHGWIEPSSLQDDLANALAKVKKGELSEPIVLGEKIYILHVQDSHSDRIQPIEEVREKIEHEITEKESLIEQKKWLKSLQEKGTLIERYL